MPPECLAVPVFAFILGLVLLALARAADRRNYIVERATPLPLSLVNVRDDVWLRGRCDTPSPAVPPHFGRPCLCYDYELEEEREEEYEDKDGKKHTRNYWVTLRKDSEATVLRLHQGERSIQVDTRKADCQDQFHDVDRIGDYRHTIWYYPCPCELSAVGCVSEGRERLERWKNIPLFLTPRARAEYVKGAEQAETLMRGLGFFLLWVACVGGVFALLAGTRQPAYFEHHEFPTGLLAVAAFLGSALFVVIGSVHLYNTIVTYRKRVDNAWVQVDVDLRQRYELVPQLVETLKGYMQHERELLERVASQRTAAARGGREEIVRGERGLAGSVGRLIALVEAYPDLKAQPLVEKLRRELTAIEEKIAHGRSTYNEAATEFNNTVMTFPRNIVAGWFGARPLPLFEMRDRPAGPGR